MVTGGNYYYGSILTDWVQRASTELLVHGAGSWTPTGPLPSAREMLKGVTLNNKIIVLGIVGEGFDITYFDV